MYMCCGKKIFWNDDCDNDYDNDDDDDNDYDYDWIGVLLSDIWMDFLILRYENTCGNRKRRLLRPNGGAVS